MSKRRSVFAWLAALFCGVEHSPCRTVSVDLLEANTMVDRDCKPVFHQVIAWQQMPGDGRYHNVGWRMITRPEDWPIREGGVYAITVIVNNRRLRITSTRMRRSHTQIDPEREDTVAYWHGEAPNVFADHEAPFVPDSMKNDE